MKHRPKLILGTVLIISSLTLLFALSQFINKQDEGSNLSIDYQENKFKLSLQIQDSDKNNFNSFLKNLNLDNYSAEDPIFFELDSTSSAKFAFQAPFKANIEPGSKELNITGTVSQGFFKQTPEVIPLDIPKSSELVIFSAQLLDSFLSRFTIPSETNIQLKEQLKPKPGHYFVTFNSAQNFAIYFKSDSNLANLEGFSRAAELQNPDTNAASTVIYQMAQTLADSQQSETNPVLFEDKGFKIFASSRETASIILNSKENISNPNNGNESDVSIYFEPKSEFNADKFLSFITQNGIYHLAARDKLANTISKIDTFSFSLKRTTFSGLINLK